MNRLEDIQSEEEDSRPRGGPRKAGFGDNHGSIASHQSLGFKARLFRVYYWMQKDRNISQFIASVLIVCLFAQIYDLLISPVMKLPFKGSLYSDISAIFDVIRIYPMVIKSKSRETYWFFMYFPLAIVFIHMVLGFLLDQSLQKTKGRYAKLFLSIKLLQILSTLMFWVLLIPAVDFFISIFECSPDTGLHLYDPQLVCWGGTHSFYCALFSVALVLFIFVTSVIALFYNESRPSHTDMLTRLDTNQEVYLVVYRIILVVVSHYTADYSTFQWLTLALHVIICTHLVKNYQHFLPYYNDFVSKTYGACCLGYAWLVGNAILIKALESDKVRYEGQIIVILVGFIMMWPTASYLKNKRVEEILLLKQQEKLKDDLELDQFVTSFQNFVQAQEDNSEQQMMFLGFLHTHREECQQTACPLRSNSLLYHPLTEQSSKRDLFPAHDKILHQHFLNSVFMDFQKNRPNTLSAQHHTQYAQFLFYQMGNVHMALVELNLASKVSTSSQSATGGGSTLQQQYTIYKYKQLIEEHLEKKFCEGKVVSSQVKKEMEVINNKAAGTAKDPQAPQVDEQAIAEEAAKLQAYAQLDVTIVITFENLFNRFQRTIEQSATDHIEFWSHLDSNMIDLNVINKLGLCIINRSNLVVDLWSQLCKINPNYPNALFLYGNYLQSIKNDPEKGEEYKNKYTEVKLIRQMEEYQDKYQVMFNEETAVVIMNGSREQQGKIMKTNLGIFKLFGYSQFEVQGHDVNILMPSLIAQKHQMFLETYFRTGKERIMNTCFETFAMYRTGVIFPVHIVVKPVPSLKNDIQYIGMIKRSEKDYEYIITDENGKIDSISEGVISLLKLPISFFKEHEIPIQILVPELCEVSRAKNHSLGGIQDLPTYFDIWSGQKDLKYIVPKNLSSAGSRGGHHFGHGASQQAQEVIASNNNNQYDIVADDFDQGSALHPSRPTKPAFLGMRSPESLKSVCSMFKNAEHRTQPDRYKTNLLNHVNYANPDFERVLKSDIQTRVYGSGEVKMRIFKIFFNRKKMKDNNKRGKEVSGAKKVEREDSENSESSSINEGDADGKQGKKAESETFLQKHGMSTIQTLNDQSFFQKYLELVAQASISGDNNSKAIELDRDLTFLKTSLEKQKKARIQGKILTDEEFDKIELERMIGNLREIEKRIVLKNNGSSLQTMGSNHAEGRVNNPIAAAFAHRLAMFVKTSQPQTTFGKLESEIASNAGIKASKNQHEEEKDNKGSLGFSQAIAQADSMKRSNNGSKAPNTRQVPDYDPGVGDVTSRFKKARNQERKEFVNEFFNSNNTPNMDHADLVRNLQNKFKATGPVVRDQPSPATEATAGTQLSADPIKEAKEEAKAEADQKSVKFALDDGGSVTSDTKTLQSSLRILRSALYENYSPQSILNLRYSAQFVTIVLIGMTIASFWFSQSKYDQLKENFKMVQHSQERMQSITGINNAARFCLLMNDGQVNRTRYGNRTDFFSKMKSDMNQKAINLQRAQNNLSQTKYDFSSDNAKIINPKNITLFYRTFEEVGTTQTVNVWSATMQQAVNAYKLKDLQLSGFQDSHMSLWFILKNSMNNILQSVRDSTEAILEDTRLISDENKHVLLILLLVASGCLLASMLIIMPVVTKVHQDKDKLLSLFLLIDQDDVKEQLKKCREFFTNFQSDDKSGLVGSGGTVGGGNANRGGYEEGHTPESEEDEDERAAKKSVRSGKSGTEKAGGSGRKGNESARGKEGEREQKEQQYKSKFQRKNKKLKKYSTNYFMLLIKFSFVIAFLESYFIYQYFQSDNFLARSLSMIKEASTISDRSFSNFFLYHVMIEIIATNGTAQVFNQKSSDYIVGYVDTFNQNLENFLKVHSDNVDKHDQSYNTFFDNLIYKSVCKSIDGYFVSEEERLQCSTYLGGVLEKGLYSANLAYWDDMRVIRDGFFKSNRSSSYLRDLINSPRLIAVERLNELYFSKAYKVLVDQQNQSINVQFDNRNKELIALFSVYLGLLILMYLLAWRRFVESMRLSLWVTKSMLAIIPTEVIEKVKVIKDFLFATSQASVRAMKD